VLCLFIFAVSDCALLSLLARAQPGGTKGAEAPYLLSQVKVENKDKKL